MHAPVLDSGSIRICFIARLQDEGSVRIDDALAAQLRSIEAANGGEDGHRDRVLGVAGAEDGDVGSVLTILRERMLQCRAPCLRLAGSFAWSLVLAMVAKSSDAGIATGLSRRTARVMSMYSFSCHRLLRGAYCCQLYGLERSFN